MSDEEYPSYLLSKVHCNELRHLRYAYTVCEGERLDINLGWNDCVSIDDITAALLKLLVDNFNIGHEGTYIEEIISQAFYECTDRSVID